jgi:glycerophosphoryl diester phosphodiesterase
MRIFTAFFTAFLLTACANPPQSRLSTQDRWLEGVDLAAYLDCAREQEVTLLQAHRAGDRPGAAENSIGAVNASLADGAIFVELDVARTADGVLVLMHDRTVDRTTNGTGRVTEMSYADFAALRLVDMEGQSVSEAPPSLKQTLEAMDGLGIAQIDLKGVDIPTIAEAIDAADAAHRSIVIVRSIDDGIALHRALPELMFSVGIDDFADVQRLIDGGVDLSRVQAWLGVGVGRPFIDAMLAERAIESSFGAFEAERDGNADYSRLANNGSEVMSVDNVPAAARALQARERSRQLLAACPAARG